MRLRILLSTLVLCLLIVPAVQAQMQSLSERNSAWEDRIVIGMPPGDDEADDEGDDEGCDCPPYPAMVPKTWLAECSDQLGNTVDCTGTGQDGEYQRGVSVYPRFNDNGNGTVLDNLTGLIWAKAANCSGAQTWMDALASANSLSHGTCGLWDGSQPGDWRLPNIKELLSLVDYGQADPALPADHPFPFARSDPYWSSSSRVEGSHVAWTVWLEVGYVAAANKTHHYYIWPVRGPE